jgi:molybdate transport system ATP-binding protein
MSIRIDIALDRKDFRLEASFEAPNNGVTAIYGPSGAGKTSLLRAIAGLEPSQGTIQVGDALWQDKSRFLATHARHVGYVFQEASLFQHMNVRQNLDYGSQRSNKAARPGFDKIVDLLGLSRLLTRYDDQLSGGERQRVAIGRALLSSPELLLMDEPLASLDASHKRELLPFLEALHQELSLPIFYVSHLPNEVARLADYLVLLHSGRVTHHGPIADLLTRLDLPLAHDEDAAALVVADVQEYDSQYDLTRLAFGDHTLFSPGRIAPDVKTQRLRIMARDVSITLAEQQDTSILNIVPARVIEISVGTGPQCLVRLDAGGTILLARITRKSAAALGLTAGAAVYAQIKTVALLD